MWDSEERGARRRHIQFANGFPPKGLVAQTLSRNAYNMHGGIFVGLQDDMSPQVGKQQRTIPPLAKGRGQFCSAKTKEDANRFKKRPDPFRQHKPAEKTSFSAYPIKHARPKPKRPLQPPKPRTAQPPPASPFTFKSLARKSVYASAGKGSDSERTQSSQESDACTVDVSMSPDTGRTKNYRVLSDVEKEFIQAELAGLEEVYQKICHGSTESLYSLLYPSLKNKKKTPVHYIQTSSPLLLRTGPKSSQYKRADDKQLAADGPREHLTEKTATELLQNSRVGQVAASAEQALQKQEKVRPILIPLPFFVSDKPSQSLPFRHQKPQREPPLVYNTKTAGKSKSVSLACPAAAVIHFNPTSPQSSVPTGAIVGVQSRCSTGKLAVVAALPGHAPPPPTPYSCVESCKDSQAPAATESEEDGGLPKVDSGTMELESVGSEASEGNVPQAAGQNGSAGADPTDGVTRDETEEEKSTAEKAQFPVLNLVTDEGEDGGVEIYLPEKRDMEKERRASVEIQTLQMEGERKAKEFETLLKEHKSIVDTVYELEKELKEEPPS